MHPQIKFIFFDIGGVALLDFSKTNKWDAMLEDVGITTELKPKFDQLFSEAELQMCVGKATIQDFQKEAESKLNVQFPKNYNMLADIVNRFELNTKIHQIVSILDKHFRLGLLTNMYPGMLNKIKQSQLLRNANWELTVDSSIVGQMKPNPEIFKIAQQKCKTKPENILFIENTQTHIDTANSLGWNTILYNPADVEASNKLIVEYFKPLGIF